jgi:hypothetical protein
MIIGICGLIGSGKGTVADILTKEHGFKKISFADSLKDGVSTIFNWDRKMLEGDTKESRDWREKQDDFWSNETGKEITPRLVLQLFGTECMRQGFFDGIWVSLVKQKILANPDKNWVVPDVRFPNEVSTISELGGKVWQVRRGEKPLWWATAIGVNQNYDSIQNNVHSMSVVFPDVHESEWRWVDEDRKFDTIIENDATLEDLKRQVLDHLS